MNESAALGRWSREFVVVVTAAAVIGGGRVDSSVVVGVAAAATSVAVIALPMIPLSVGFTTPSVVDVLLLLCA